MVTIYYSNRRSQSLQVEPKPRVGVWVHAATPSPEELQVLCDTYGLDLDLLSDALDIYESPRIEREGNAVYVYTRYCFPEGAEIATEPLLIIYTPDHLLTVSRQVNPVINQLIEGAPQIITTQRTKTFLQILAGVNRTYERHLHKTGRQILRIRGQLRKTEIRNEDFVDFIDLEEDLNEILSALQAQSVVLRSLLNGRYVKLFEDDKDLVEDLSLGTAELIELTISRLKTISNTREAYSTIMANNLNRIFKRLTSIGIFMAVPTIMASLYGMNVPLPNATSAYAFWEVIGLASVLTLGFIFLFKKLKWL